MHRLSLRTSLWSILLAALLPVMAMAVLLVWRAGTDAQQAAQQRLQEANRSAAQLVDAEWALRIGGLRALLQQWPPQQQAPAALAARLRDASAYVGAPLHIEWVAPGAGSPQPGSVADLAASAALRGHAVVSRLVAPGAGQSLSVAVPGMAAPDGRVPVLVAVFEPHRLLSSLQPLPAGANSMLFTAVVDGAGHVVAHTRGAEDVPGALAPHWALLREQAQRQGAGQVQTSERGDEVLAFQRLDAAPGWLVVSGNTAASIHGPWRQLLAGLAVACGLTLWLGVRLSRALLAPIQALAAQARSLVEADRGQPLRGLPPVSSGIRELQVLCDNLHHAAAALVHRMRAERAITEALRLSERRHRLLASAGALVLWRLDPKGVLVEVMGYRKLTGRSHRDALGTAWLRQIHREDRPQVLQACRQALRQGALVDLEFRVLAAQGLVRWVRARGTCIRDEQERVLEWNGVLEDIHERRMAQAQALHMAHHDMLTGLPNRVLFHQRLDQLLARAARGRPGALLLLDLDRFKQVNDSWGHAAGDALLRQAAQRLQALVRSGDTVARLGGDEFAILLDGLVQPADAERLAERVVRRLGEPYALGAHTLLIGASVGITSVQAGTTAPEQLLHDADIALYRAKALGRGRYCVHGQELVTRAA